MGARTDFWLYVHELSLCLDEEGDTSDQRRENILDSLVNMPPMARQEVCRQLRYVVSELSVLNEWAKTSCQLTQDERERA